MRLMGGWLAPVLVVVCLLGGCQQRPSRVVLGVALAQSSHPAVQLAADEINAAGGIDGVPVELMGMEWITVEEARPEEALKWAERFSGEEDLLAIIGHSDSASSLVAAPLYNARGIPQLVTIATHPAITQIGAWTYRLSASDAHQGRILAEYAVRDLGARRLALFLVNDDYGRGLAAQVRRQAEALGAKVVATLLHRNVLQAGDKEAMEAALQRLRIDPPDQFILLQRIEAATWTVRRIRELNISSGILGGDNLAVDGSSDAWRKMSAGVQIFQVFVPPENDAWTREIQVRSNDPGERRADYSDAFAYDAVYLAREAILGGGFSRAGIRAHLEGMAAAGTWMDGVGGHYRFGPDRNARREAYILELRPDRNRVVKVFPAE